MAVRVVLADDFEENMTAAGAEVLRTRFGPAIRDDAKRYAPKDTGALADSVEDHMEGTTLVVSATGGAGDPPREYAAYVEAGHRVYHPSTGITGPEVVPPQPFLRPALYQERGDGE